MLPTSTPPPHTWAITGGIGSGKTTVCSLIRELYTVPIFYCDDEAKHIIRTHPHVKAELTQLIGPDLYDARGQLRKSVMATYLTASTTQASQVNAIVHPRVAEAWQAFCTDKPMAIMECALLFESDFDHLVQHTIAVVCEREERIRRVMRRDHIDRDTVLRWLSLQWPDEQVRAKAHHLIDTTSGQREAHIAQIQAIFGKLPHQAQ